MGNALQLRRRARQLCERNARLRQEAAEALRSAREATVAAAATRLAARFYQHGDERADYWATLVEDAAQQLLLTEEQTLFAGLAWGDRDDRPAGERGRDAT